MAKSKTQSQTIVVNTALAAIGAVLLGLEGSMGVLKGVMPEWGYVAAIVAINVWNAWRRTKTTEAIK
jgi:hypothetical protein